MSVIRASQAPIFETPDAHITGYTSPSRGASEICTWRVQFKPGAKSPAHWLDHEETFLLLDGTLHFSIGQETIALAAGDALAMPAHTTFQIANPGPETAYSIVCLPVGGQGTLADGTVVGVPPWAR